MAVIIYLNAAGRFGQFEQLRNLLQQFALRCAFGKLAVKRLFGIARRLFDKPHPVAALRHADFDFTFGPFGQRLRQQVRLGQLAIEKDAFGRRNVLVELGKEAGEHLVLAHFRNMRGKERTMPPILPATNEKRLNAHNAIAVRQRENIGIADTLGVNCLRPLDEGECLQTVAYHGRPLEIERLGGQLHLFRQLCLHNRGFAIEKGFCVSHKAFI